MREDARASDRVKRRDAKHKKGAVSRTLPGSELNVAQVEDRASSGSSNSCIARV